MLKAFELIKDTANWIKLLQKLEMNPFKHDFTSTVIKNYVIRLLSYLAHM